MIRYFKIASIIFRQELSSIIEYRTNFILNIVSGLIGFIFLVSVWQALRPNEFTSVIWAFYVLISLLVDLNGEGFYRKMSADINSGNLSFVLLQPYSYFLRMSSKTMANSLVSFVITLAIVLLASFLIRGSFSLSPVNILIAIPFIFVGRLISLLFSFLVGCVSFVWPNPDAFYLVIDVIIGALFGALIPFWFLPSSWQQVINLLPFRAVVATPVEIILGRASNPIPLLAVSLIWLAIMIFFATRIWKRVLNLYEAVGG